MKAKNLQIALKPAEDEYFTKTARKLDMSKSALARVSIFLGLPRYIELSRAQRVLAREAVRVDEDI